MPLMRGVSLVYLLRWLNTCQVKQFSWLLASIEPPCVELYRKGIVPFRKLLSVKDGARPESSKHLPYD